MELIAFRVRMYKGIIDSGWVDVNSLTVLVGKNESGKTSLLNALHKLNPYKSETYEPEPYEIAKEWPRKHWGQRSEEHVVCRAKFQLSDEEKAELAQIAERETFPDVMEVSRNYAGQLEINFGEDICLDDSPSIEIDPLLDRLPKVEDNFSREFRKCVNDCLDEVRRFMDDRQFTELHQLYLKHRRLLRSKRVQPDHPSYHIEGRFINRYSVRLSRLDRGLQQSRSAKLKARDYIVEHLPTFVYIDDYRTFSGNAHLKDIQTRRGEDRLTEADRTFLMILRLSGLDLDKLVRLADEGKLQERRYDVEYGAATLTKKMSDQELQRCYEVEYRVDGSSFFTCVRDDIDPSPIDLKDRSKGYQWFFSFDLMLMHETESTFKGCVILLDEPGLHLHPETQKGLLGRLEKYAKENTLLYTTHLPFMIDLDHPDRIRILKETKKGIVVTTDFAERTSGAQLVLEVALGMKAAQNYLVARRNLVVEGYDDYWILTELSNLLQRDGIDGLPEDVKITPGEGASKAVYIATFMIGQDLGVVALFDSDKAGRDAQKRLTHSWLTQCTEPRAKAILLGDAVEISGDFAIEDLFPENFVTDIVKEFHSEVLASAGIEEIQLKGKDMLWRRIERFMEDNDIEINKGPIIKRLCNRLSNMKDVSELPSETKERAVKLFQEIHKAFGEKESESS